VKKFIKILCLVLGLAVLAPFIVKARDILKEVGELLISLSNALADGKVSVDEVKAIVEEAKGVLGVFGKKK